LSPRRCSSRRSRARWRRRKKKKAPVSRGLFFFGRGRDLSAAGLARSRGPGRPLRSGALRSALRSLHPLGRLLGRLGFLGRFLVGGFRLGFLRLAFGLLVRALARHELLGLVEERL